jgi:ATP-dependent Clp protease, protease subunit
MYSSKFQYNKFRMEEEEEKPSDDKRDDLMMLNKKLERYFFDQRAVYLWGPVEDKSAREVVTKMLLLDADKPGEEIKFLLIVQVALSPAAWSYTTLCGC